MPQVLEEEQVGNKSGTKGFFSEQNPQNPTLEVEAKGDVPKTNKRTVT